MDAGERRSPDGGQFVRRVLAANGVTSVDFFIATHYHADHIGGVAQGDSHGTSFVLGNDGVPGGAGDDDGNGVVDWVNQFVDPDPQELGVGDDIPVGTFVDRGDTPQPTTQVYDKYVGIANVMGTRVSLNGPAEVNSFEIDLGGGARMTALSANGFVRNRATRVARVNTENERSLCFLLQFGGFHYLLGGDTIGRSAAGENAKVEEAIGEYITANGINVDVLHVNHHGANNTSEADFLTAIDAYSPPTSIKPGFHRRRFRCRESCGSPMALMPSMRLSPAGHRKRRGRRIRTGFRRHPTHP